MQNIEKKIKAGETLTIKETEEVIDFIDATADSIVKAADDGKLNWVDLRHTLAPLKKVGPAFKDVKKVLPELKDVDAAEAERLYGRFEITVSKWAAAIAALGELDD